MKLFGVGGNSMKKTMYSLGDYKLELSYNPVDCSTCVVVKHLEHEEGDALKIYWPCKLNPRWYEFGVTDTNKATDKCVAWIDKKVLGDDLIREEVDRRMKELEVRQEIIRELMYQNVSDTTSVESTDGSNSIPGSVRIFQ